MEKRNTPAGQSYWNNNGAYQEEHDRLWAELVPASGSCGTIHGELIRAVARLFYEFCNNGNCNAIDVEMGRCPHCGGDGQVDTGYDEDEEEDTYEDCSWCDGSGEVEGDTIITPFYGSFLDLIEDNVPDAPVQEVRDFMEDSSRGYSRYKFDDTEMGIYNALTDSVIHHILTTENSEYKGGEIFQRGGQFGH
jgi:hypothetical protein